MPLPSGLCAFPITPMDEHGTVDAAGLHRLLRPLVTAGVDAVGLLGSTGLYPFLSREQRRRTVGLATSELGGRVPLMVGVGALRTDATIAHARDAEAEGADAVLLAPMSYTPLTEEEVAAHVAAVAEAVRVPVCLYNNPATTHFTISASLTARLSRVGNVLGVKHPAPAEGATGLMRELREQVAPGFSLGWSVDAHAAEALLAGGDAWYSVAAGMFPVPCLALARAAAAGDASEARWLNDRLRPLWALFAEHSSLRVMYAAAALLGLSDLPPPRPLLLLGEAARRQVADTLRALELA